jgi:hypothetical protein
MFEELVKKFEAAKAEITDLRKKVNDLLSGDIKNRLDAIENKINSTKVELDSPDGKTSVLLEVTDVLSGVWVQNDTYRVAIFVENDKAGVKIENMQTGEVRSL